MMKLLHYLVDLFRPKDRVHLCDVCLKPMEANGDGICDPCEDAIDRYNSKDFHTYMQTARAQKFKGL